MPSQLTQQQRLAVEHRATAVVLASGAGCGKTHVLTARYLDHLRTDHAEVSQLVAITFTERAAREMRDRIRKAIRAQRDAALPNSEELERWQRHLRNLENALITTIHGFCGGVLRQYPLETELDPTFGVLDSALGANLQTEALDDSLRTMLTDASEGTPSADSAALRELVVLFGWNEVRGAVQGFLREPAPTAWAEWLALDPTAIAERWWTVERPPMVMRVHNRILCDVPQIGELARIVALTPDGQARLAFVAEQLGRIHTPGGPAPQWDELADKAKVGNAAAAKKLYGPDDYDTIRDAYKAIREQWIPAMRGLMSRPANLEESARVGQSFVRVARRCAAHYQERKRAAGVADFQDLLLLTHQLLLDNPTIVATLAERYPYFLLDELQDTDPVQMSILQSLASAGTMFAVGDLKQSIYRFRGADVRLFQSLRDEVPSVGRMDLTRNYRSQPGVIRFVNSLCRKWFPDEAALEAHRENFDALPKVEFLWTLPDEPPEIKPSAEELRQREAVSIASRIRELLADPTACIAEGDTLRRVLAKDFVLLFRSMTQVRIYEAALRQQQLEYYLIGGRAFFAQQEIYDLLHLLRSLENPHDALSVVGLLRSPFCHLSDAAIHVLASQECGPWLAVQNPALISKLPPDDRPAAARAGRLLPAWRLAKDRLPLVKLLSRVVAQSGFDAAMQLEFLGDRKLANLWKLMDLAREFDRTGQGTAAFVMQLTELVENQPREEQAATQPENADVVKLMSIHQAKGLEFPIVIVPDLGARTRASSYPVGRWDRRLGGLVRLPNDLRTPDDPAAPYTEFAHELGASFDTIADEDESLRVFYVACTRARDRLILSGAFGKPFEMATPTPPPEGHASYWLESLAERFDLATGECLCADGLPEELEPVEVRLVPLDGPPIVLPELPDDVATPLPRLPAPLSSVVAFPPVVSLLGLVRGEVFEENPDAEAGAPLRELLDSMSIAERFAWQAIGGWTHFDDADGWREELANALAEWPDADEARELQPQLTTWCQRFAESRFREPLHTATTANTLLRDAEFVLELGTKLPAVRGLFDFAWPEGADWHLLKLHFGSSDSGSAASLVRLQAFALYRAMAKPITFSILELATGRITTRTLEQLDLPSLTRTARAVLDSVSPDSP